MSVSDKSLARALCARPHALILRLVITAVLASGIAGCKLTSGREIVGARSATSIAGGASLYRFTAGERLIYSLDYSGKSASDFRALFAGQAASGANDQPPPILAHSFNTSVRGELVITVIDKKPDGFLVAYRLQNPVLSLIADEQEAATEAAAIKADLSRDIFALVNLQGKVLSVRFDPATNKISQTFARAILAALQVIFPNSEKSNLNQWETQEEDTNGQYIARYRSETRHGPEADSPTGLKVFRKAKVRYLQPHKKSRSDRLDVPKNIRPAGELTAHFDLNEGRLVSLSGAESQVIEIAGKAVARAESTLQLKFLDKQTLSSSELSSIRSASAARENVAAVPLSAAPSEEESETAIHRTELGEATIDSLLMELAERGDAAAESSSLYLKFKALVYLQPETSARLGNIIATVDARSAAMSILTGALASVGHNEAQAAIVAAIRARKKDWQALSMLIPALTAPASPTESAEETLRDLALNSPYPEISSTALLALGAMARNLSESAPQRAEQIAKLLISKIEAASSVEEKKTLLLALGNAGSIQTFSTIARFVKDSSPLLRAAAMSALRFIESREAEELLTKALSLDREAAVRLEAAAALGFREMNAATFKVQKKAFLTDRDDNVRLALLSNLWKAREAFPEVRQIVKTAAEKDRSKDVRKAAAEILGRDSKAHSDR